MVTARAAVDRATVQADGAAEPRSCRDPAGPGLLYSSRCYRFVTSGASVLGAVGWTVIVLFDCSLRMDGDSGNGTELGAMPESALPRVTTTPRSVSGSCV
jgi:hypothetical protein